MQRFLVTIAIVMLAACGGGGSGSALDPVEPPPGPPDSSDPPDPPDSSDPPELSLHEVAGGFVQPTYVTGAGDGSGRLFVVERRGVVHLLHDDGASAEPFLDITDRVTTSGNEQGLLSIAFPPGFAETGHFYASYTDLDGDAVVARFLLDADDPDTADAGTGTVLLQVEQPFDNHNGGQLEFGPDGYLYVGLGDGGSGGDPLGHGQDRTTLLGTLLRIDVEGGDTPYGIPDDNPFGDEVWAFGLRNPWRFSFDRATGDLFIGDVGQSAIEEINFEPAGDPGGHNYGWNVMEGSECFSEPNCDTSGLTLPVWEYANAAGNCSVTGGFVARGDAPVALHGTYVYGDFCSGRIWGLTFDDGEWHNALLLESPLMISSFGEDDAGSLYVVDYSGGAVHRIVVAD